MIKTDDTEMYRLFFYVKGKSFGLIYDIKALKSIPCLECCRNIFFDVCHYLTNFNA